MENKAAAATIIAKISRSFIRFPHVQYLLKRMQEILEREWVNEEADSLFLPGESGVGKSTLLTKFCNMYPPIVHDEFTEIPVLYARVPAQGTPLSLAGAMLLEMGSPFWNVGKIEDRRYQLVCLIRKCKVRLIILDEVNHVTDKNGSKTHHYTGDWLKELFEELKIPVVLAGTPSSDRLLHTNKQLRTRFREIIPIMQFSLTNKSAQDECEKMMKTFSNMITGVSKVDITQGPLLSSMIFATAGQLRDIRRLLVKTVVLAFEHSPPKITVPILAQAFRQAIYRGAPDKRNPFCKEFDGIPLIKPGEPFAPEEK